MDYLPNNIRFLREALGKTQTDVASALGFSKSTISGYELGSTKPSYKDLFKLFEYFGTTATELIETDIENAHLTKKELGNSFTGKSASKSASKGASKCAKEELNLVQEPGVVYEAKPAITEVSRLHSIISSLEAAVQSLSASNARHLKDIEVLQAQNTALKKEIFYISGQNDNSNAETA